MSADIALLRLYISDPPGNNEFLHDSDLQILLDNNDDGVEAAAADGWRIKAARVAEWYQMTLDGAFLDRGQVFEHCMAMAKHFEETGGGSLTNVRMDSEYRIETTVDEF